MNKKEYFNSIHTLLIHIEDDYIDKNALAEYLWTREQLSDELWMIITRDKIFKGTWDYYEALCFVAYMTKEELLNYLPILLYIEPNRYILYKEQYFNVMFDGISDRLKFIIRLNQIKKIQSFGVDIVEFYKYDLNNISRNRNVAIERLLDYLTINDKKKLKYDLLPKYFKYQYNLALCNSGKHPLVYKVRCDRSYDSMTITGELPYNENGIALDYCGFRYVNAEIETKFWDGCNTQSLVLHLNAHSIVSVADFDGLNLEKKYAYVGAKYLELDFSRLRKIREQKCTRTELAEFMGYSSTSSIKSWENGYNSCDGVNLLRLLATLDIGIEALTRYNIEKEIETELMSPYFEYVVAE